MTHEEAVSLIAESTHDRPKTWADLGCGDGTFTIALASVLPAGSVIHAMDQNARQLRRIPRAHAGTSIHTHAGDFTSMPWPFGPVDGVLLANALHYVQDRMSFIRACEPSIRSPRRFIIVEYDTDRPNRWVPYPISSAALQRTFAAAGYRSFTILGARPSIYQRASLYAAAIAQDPQ